MKKGIQKSLAFLLCFVLMCSVAPFGVFAEENVYPQSINAALPDDEAEDPLDLPELAIVNYRRFLIVPEGARLEFNTTESAPEGYRIQWNNGYIDNATEKTYTVYADLVRISDGEVVKSTKPETIYVLRGALTRWCIEKILFLYSLYFFTVHISGGLPVNFFISYKDNRIGIDHYVGRWGE